MTAIATMVPTVLCAHALVAAPDLDVTSGWSRFDPMYPTYRTTGTHSSLLTESSLGVADDAGRSHFIGFDSAFGFDPDRPTRSNVGDAFALATPSLNDLILRAAIADGYVKQTSLESSASFFDRPDRSEVRPASQPWTGERDDAAEPDSSSNLSFGRHLSRGGSDRPFDSRLGKRFDVGTGFGLELGLDTLGTSTFNDEIGIAAPSHSIAHLSGNATSVKIVDASLGWDAYSSGLFHFSVLGGIRGIGLGTDDRAPLPGQREGSFEAVPILGGQMQFNVDRDVFVRGKAIGSFGSTDSDYLDFGAEFGVGLTTWADIVAGYKFLRADLADAGAELDDQSFYASLRLQY